MPLGEERRRIAGDERLQLGRDLIRGSPKRSEAMRLFTLATSLGGVESLVSIPVLTSHAMISAEQRAEMGVTEQMVRLSVGIESVEDQIEDLERALEAMSSRVGVPVGSSSRS